MKNKAVVFINHKNTSLWRNFCKKFTFRTKSMILGFNP